MTPMEIASGFSSGCRASLTVPLHANVNVNVLAACAVIDGAATIAVRAIAHEQVRSIAETHGIYC